MKAPLFIRAVSAEEREALEAGLRSPNVWVFRRCQCLLKSAEGFTPRQIQRMLRVSDETVRRAIKAFEREGLGCLDPKPVGRKHPSRLLPPEQLGSLEELLHRSPREFGLATSLWTLEGAAKVSFEQGLTPQQVSKETIRRAMKELKVGWKRAKRWIQSPDPAYARKRGPGTG